MNHAVGREFAKRGEKLPEIRARPFERGRDQLPVSNLLSPDQQLLLRGISTLAEFRAGEGIVFTEGDEASFIYVVVSGMVRISRCAESGRRQVLSFELPGGIFGFPDQGCYINSAKAMGDTALYRIPWLQLNELLQHEPLLQNSFLVRAVFDLRQAQKRILVLGQQNVSQRLASFLLDLMEYEDFFDAQQKKLLLPVSRFDLADYLGTSPETVVRAMARLEKDDLIRRLSSRLLLVPNSENLARLLLGRRRND